MQIPKKDTNGFAYLLLTLVSIILTSSLTSINSINATSDSNNAWYIGKQLTKNMFAIYQIQDLEINNDRPFTMGIYFQGQDGEGNWNSTVWVYDQDRIVNGTVKFDSPSLLPLVNATEKELSQYLVSYRDSLAWVARYANSQHNQSLSAQWWTEQACQGTCRIGVLGIDNLSVPAGNFSTTVIGWQKNGITNKIWINKDFPFPVKATVYADLTSKSKPPIQFAFQLLSYGITRNPPLSVPEFSSSMFVASTFIGAITIILVSMKQQVKLRW